MALLFFFFFYFLFSAICYKGVNLCDSLFGFLYIRPLLKKSLLPSGSKLFPLSVDPFQKSHPPPTPPLKVYQVFLNSIFQYFRTREIWIFEAKLHCEGGNWNGSAICEQNKRSRRNSICAVANQRYVGQNEQRLHRRGRDFVVLSWRNREDYRNHDFRYKCKIFGYSLRGSIHLHIFAYFYTGDNFFTSCLLLYSQSASQKESSLLERNMIPFGANSFLLQCTPFYITKTCLYNIDTLKPHFCIVKLGFTGGGVYLIFLISAQKT